MGWHRADEAWWPIIIETLPRPLSREAALMDMRWHGDKKRISGIRIPGRSFFAARWRWTDKKTRILIASFDWWDSFWGEEASAAWGPEAARVRAESKRAKKGPKKGLRKSQEGPNDSSANANNGEVEGQERANEGPAEGPRKSTGVKETPTPTPSPTPSLSSKERAIRAAFDRLAVFWAAQADISRERDRRPGDRKPRAIQPPKWSSKTDPTNGLKRLIGEMDSEDDVALLIRWHWHGPDPRGNRGAGRHLITLSRHHEDYIVLAADWADGKRPAPSRPKTGADKHDFGAMLREIEREEQQTEHGLVVHRGGRDG